VGVVIIMTSAHSMSSGFVMGGRAEARRGTPLWLLVGSGFPDLIKK